MNTGAILGAGALLLIGSYFMKLNRTVNNLNYYIAGAGLSFDGYTPILRLDLGIQNPDANSFTIKSIVGNLYTNRILIGNIYSFTPVTIPPVGSITYPLFIRMSLIGVVSDIVKIFTGGGIRQEIEFAGTIRIDNITAPLNFNYTLG